jgi:predicted metal-dependent hydrolase
VNPRACGREGTFQINWLRVFAPRKVQEYVVVHELAHLRQPSHGPEFWAFLEFLLPDFERPKAWLAAHQGSLDDAFLRRGG